MSNGRFVWRDLNSVDPDVSKAFFAGLLGWTYTDMSMGEMSYFLFGVNGVNIGGVSKLDPAQGIPSNFSSYLLVEDVDAAAQKAVSLGGKLLFGPDDIPNVGRFAALLDPEGAAFNLFKNGPGYSNPPVADGRTPFGTVSWNELLSADPTAEFGFYSQIVDWSVEKRSQPGMDYWIAKQGEAMLAGGMVRPEMVPISLWSIYFAVADIEASVAKAKELGGSFFTEIMPIEGIGRIAAGADPTGAGYVLIQETF